MVREHLSGLKWAQVVADAAVHLKLALHRLAEMYWTFHTDVMQWGKYHCKGVKRLIEMQCVGQQIVGVEASLEACKSGLCVTQYLPLRMSPR